MYTTETWQISDKRKYHMKKPKPTNKSSEKISMNFHLNHLSGTSRGNAARRCASDNAQREWNSWRSQTKNSPKFFYLERFGLPQALRGWRTEPQWRAQNEVDVALKCDKSWNNNLLHAYFVLVILYSFKIFWYNQGARSLHPDRCGSFSFVPCKKQVTTSKWIISYYIAT